MGVYDEATLKQIDRMIADYQGKIEMLENMKAKMLREQGPKKWGSIEEMMADIKKLPKKEPPSPLTLEQIYEELDIIRGRKPTPPGYSVRPERMKELMQRRKELTRS